MFEIIRNEWPAIAQAPFSFLAALVVLAGLIWAVVQFYYKGRLDTLKERIDSLRERLDGRTPEDLRCQIADLEAALKDLSPRRITPEQKQLLVQYLARRTGRVFFTHLPGVPDSLRYAHELGLVFGEAGWTVSNLAGGMPETLSDTNLILVDRDPEDRSPAQTTVIDALEASGIAFEKKNTWTDNYNVAAVDLIVGSGPI